MRHRYSALLLSCLLIGAFGSGLFIKPMESQANPQQGWKAEYFKNPNLLGTPLLTTSDEKIDMNWAEAAPAQNFPADNFSVRWTTSTKLEAGHYHFEIGADDGIRLIVDGEVILDAFEPGSFRTFSYDLWLDAGKHDFQVDYFEETGMAGVFVEWQRIDSSFPYTPEKDS